METVIESYRTLLMAMESAPPSVHFLHGTEGVYHTAMLAAGELLRREEKVTIVDAANVTDPFFLASLFKSAGMEPEPLLQHGYISRCYTFYQVDVTVTDGLAEFLRSVQGRTLLVFGLLDLIDDDQVPTADIHDIITRMQQSFDALKREGVRILLVSPPLHFQLKEREAFFTLFREIADVSYRIDSAHRRTAKRGRDGKTDRHRHTSDRQGTGAVGKFPPRAAQRTTGALR